MTHNHNLIKETTI